MAGPRPLVVNTVADLRAAVGGFRQNGEKVALVPTMGALHIGHVALVRRAREMAERVVVSIFVNPAQFGPSEDFERYPRTLEADLEKLAPEGVDVVYAPNGREMYPEGFATKITMAGPAEGLETDFRPHFFAGVATVVGKLFIQCTPDYAMFGEKDYQQLKVVTRLSRDLDLGVDVVPNPIVREQDGLALSSRNAYLSPQERAVAPVIFNALSEAAKAIRDGASPEACADHARARIAQAELTVDYVVARNAETLAPLASPDEPVRLLAAAWLGKTRLIDNMGV